jgi:hypothetical protein
MPTRSRLVDAADRRHLDAIREVAAQVLNVFAVVSLGAATARLPSWSQPGRHRGSGSRHHL